MSGGFGYGERQSYSGGSNGYSDNRLGIHDAIEETLRHNVSGNATPGGNLHHSYECPCRDGAYMHGALRRELEPNQLGEAIRRNHQTVDQVNRTIGAGAVWSEIHPKMKSDGTYPKEFLLPKTHYEFKAMDIGVIDRILLSYNISETNGTSSDQRKSRDQDVRKRKLGRLYEYLGADRLVPKRSDGDQNYTKHGYSNR